MTSTGFLLTYLVDTAGTKTTNDPVNRTWNVDYCRKVFNAGRTNHPEQMSNANIDAVKQCHHRLEGDDMDVFTLNNMKISQARDGMIR